MKKLLLTGAMLCVAYFSANAQSQTITSFEESETAAYIVGDDIGTYTTQWSTYSSANDDDVDAGVITISDAWASEGTQSLMFSPLNNQDDEANYAIGPLYDFSTLSGTAFELTFDTRTNVVSTTSSNLGYQLTNYDATANTQTTFAKVQFDYSGTILVWDSTEDQSEDNNYGYVEATGFSAATNYTVKVRFNVDQSLTYVVNGEDVYTFTPADTSVLNGSYYPVFYTDDYNSTWYVDNLTIALPTAGVVNPSLTQFAVYPNPASSVINVSNTDALVNNVALTDLNGRTVKTVKYNGASDAQVNIADLASGVYLLTISSDKGTTTKKVVKE